jgi:hypothetical protein
MSYSTSDTAWKLLASNTVMPDYNNLPTLPKHHLFSQRESAAPHVPSPLTRPSATLSPRRSIGIYTSVAFQRHLSMPEHPSPCPSPLARARGEGGRRPGEGW